jgi:hypothetical protein
MTLALAFYQTSRQTTGISESTEKPRPLVALHGGLPDGIPSPGRSWSCAGISASWCKRHRALRETPGNELDAADVFPISSAFLADSKHCDATQSDPMAKAASEPSPATPSRRPSMSFRFVHKLVGQLPARGDARSGGSNAGRAWHDYLV